MHIFVDDDDDDDESGEEADGTTYTAFSNTPTRITLTAKVSHTKRKNSGLKVKVEFKCQSIYLFNQHQLTVNQSVCQSL